MKSTVTLQCLNGFTLYARGSNLIVSTKHSEEAFPVSNIQSFTLKEPGGISQGKITFRTAQASTAGINLGLGIGAAIGAEKAFFFKKSELENARSIRDFVTGDAPAAAGKTVVSVVEELRGLKGLLDDGILTPDEFNAKKRQLLNL